MIFLPKAPTLILPDRWMRQPCQQQQGHFGLGFIKGGTAAASTWDPANNTNYTLSNGNLTASKNTTGPASTLGTTANSSSKKYFEVKAVSYGNGNCSIGVSAGTNYPNNPGLYTTSAAIQNGGVRVNGGDYTAGLTVANNDFIGVAVDQPNHLIYFSQNGTWMFGGNPAANSGGLDYVTTAPVYPVAYSNLGTSQTDTLILNTASPFNTAPPSGFTAWG